MSYVYVFGVPGDNLVKVGYSRAPDSRRGCLRHVWKMPEGLILFRHRCDADRVEKLAHYRLAEHHVEGEWFLVTAEQAAAVIVECSRDESRPWPPVKRFMSAERARQASEAAKAAGVRRRELYGPSGKAWGHA